MRLIYRDPNYISKIDTGVNKIIITFFDEELSVIKEFDLQFLNFNEAYELFKLDFESENQIIAQLQLSEKDDMYVYIKESQIYLSKESDFSQLEFKNKLLKIENDRSDLKFLQTGKARFVLSYEIEGRKDILFVTNDILSRKKENTWLDFEITDTNPPHKKVITLSKIELNDKYLFLMYYPKRKQVNVSKVFIEDPDLRISDIAVLDRRTIELKINNRTLLLPFRKQTPTILLGKNKGTLSTDEKVKIRINGKNFYLYTRNDQIYCSRNQFEVYGIKSNLRASFLFNKLIICGKYFNTGKDEFGAYDYLYIKNTAEPIGKFKRLNKSGKGRSWGYAIIDVDTLTKETDIHRSLTFGGEKEPVYPLFMRRETPSIRALARRRWKNSAIILRSNVGGGTSFTNIPYSQEYTFVSSIKIIIAKYFSKISPKKKVNLYFEKMSNKADESAIRVFEKVMKHANLNSTNLFILNKRSVAYPELKKKYKKNIVAKYSFKHFYSIFQANYFISSELANHVINDRLFINDLSHKIATTPLIFLQHGIMFAKPIDNPMARAFHKKNLACNVQKSVISSELEAEQFYKAGYDENDLLLTGLAAFDYAKLSAGTDKIAYMPTYRYWEQHLLYNDNVEQTSYYQGLLQVIKLFEENNLLDKLLIVPHNKFATYLCDKFPNYSKNIHTNPSAALKEAKIFITDYSSAIYDAIIRGAYPIFYWEAKDYLIENYKAIPPVNDENAPGPIAYSKEALIEIIQNAIKNNYQLEDEYVKKYRKINQFSDGKNTERIVEYLINEDIV